MWAVNGNLQVRRGKFVELNFGFVELLHFMLNVAQFTTVILEIL